MLNHFLNELKFHIIRNLRFDFLKTLIHITSSLATRTNHSPYSSDCLHFRLFLHIRMLLTAFQRCRVHALEDHGCSESRGAREPFRFCGCGQPLVV